MSEFFAPAHVLILLIVTCILMFPVIFFLLTLHKTLQKCAPEARTLEPGMVWIYVVPIVHLIFGFFLVRGMGKSLRNEFDRRGLPVTEEEPGQTVGIGACVCACLGIIPIVGGLFELAFLVLGIVYWVKIADYSKQLDMQVPFVPPPPYAG